MYYSVSSGKKMYNRLTLQGKPVIKKSSELDILFSNLFSTFFLLEHGSFRLEM